MFLTSVMALLQEDLNATSAPYTGQLRVVSFGMCFVAVALVCKYAKAKINGTISIQDGEQPVPRDGCKCTVNEVYLLTRSGKNFSKTNVSVKSIVQDLRDPVSRFEKFKEYRCLLVLSPPGPGPVSACGVHDTQTLVSIELLPTGNIVVAAVKEKRNAYHDETDESRPFELLRVLRRRHHHAVSVDTSGEHAITFKDVELGLQEFGAFYSSQHTAKSLAEFLAKIFRKGGQSASAQATLATSAVTTAPMGHNWLPKPLTWHMITQRANQMGDLTTFDSLAFNICIIGPSRAGKSALIKSLMEQALQAQGLQEQSQSEDDKKPRDTGRFPPFGMHKLRDTARQSPTRHTIQLDAKGAPVNFYEIPPPFDIDNTSTSINRYAEQYLLPAFDAAIILQAGTFAEWEYNLLTVLSKNCGMPVFFVRNKFDVDVRDESNNDSGNYEEDINITKPFFDDNTNSNSNSNCDSVSSNNTANTNTANTNTTNTNNTTTTSSNTLGELIQVVSGGKQRVEDRRLLELHCRKVISRQHSEFLPKGLPSSDASTLYFICSVDHSQFDSARLFSAVSSCVLDEL